MKFTVSIQTAAGTETIEVLEGYHVQPIDFFADLAGQAEPGTVLTMFKDGIAVANYTA